MSRSKSGPIGGGIVSDTLLAAGREYGFLYRASRKYDIELDGIARLERSVPMVRRGETAAEYVARAMSVPDEKVVRI